MTTARYISEDSDLDALYADISTQDLQPLWEMRGLLTPSPRSKAVPFRWRIDEIREFGARAMNLVPIDRGGDRRVLAMANPGLDGAPFISNTLWAALQFLGPGEYAPAHRHSPAALRFILEGEGVWSLVNGDPIHMSRGDLVLTPAWNYHEHHNPSQDPMVWLDILDLPLVQYLDAIFFEEGPSEDVERKTDPRSVSERLFGQGSGLVPAGADSLETTIAHSPLLVYRWAQTNDALDALLETSGRDEAIIRYQDPVTGADVMPTMRCEMRRVTAGTTTRSDRQTGSRACTVLNGHGVVTIDGAEMELREGDIFVVPSWAEQRFRADETLDVFITSDAPVLSALRLFRSEVI